MKVRKLERSLALALLCGVASMSVAASAIAQGPTLESVLSAPFPTDLTASSGDGRIVWISNEQGVRNVMLAERRADGSFATRALTGYTRDDGYELDHLTWANGGKAIVFTGGGSLEGGGPVNTESLAAGPMVKEVLALTIGETTPRNFGPGEAPEADPKGDRIAFIRGGQIWIASLGASGAATQLVHDRGSAGSLSWSPDGSKLAFVSRRRDGQALLGIYDVAAATISWMSPGTDRDAAPRWSADGKRIAWIRIPAGAQSKQGFLAVRTGPPWSVWVGDVATGAAKPVWRADTGRGSVFRNVEDGSALFWTADDRLVFPWEKTGWIRLYSIPATGGPATALTPDGSEVFAADLDASKTKFVFSSNATDDDHRHLWEVSAAGGAPRMLTRGASVEDLPAINSDGIVYALHSTGRDPLAPVAVRPGGAMEAVYTPAASARFPRKALVEPQRVVFDSSDKLPVHGQLFMPKGKASDKKPAILFFHGGPQRQMLLGWHPMGAYTHLYAMNQFLASQGYIVLSVNFRGGTGYGTDWREPIGFAETGGSEVRDIAGAVAYLKGRADVDTARIGVYGMSYGGVMTSLALAKLPQEFAAGVDIAGVHDWKTFLPYLTEPGAPPGPADLAFNSSAISSVADWRAPVLIIQGDDDRAVNFSQSVELVGALRNVGKVEPELFVLPDEVHDFIRHRSWLSVFDKAQEFLQRKLMKKGQAAKE
jgi:dipeptidyl aminopeptidase/acylaminoacyl peptidase